MDETPSEGGDKQLSTEPESLPHQAEVERNRKRFEFWHILRTDCFFRMCYGKPTLIPAGSWKVNFPDPNISSVNHESSRFINIHFIASMRLTLIVMKYLDWVDGGKDPDPVSHDATIDSFIDEVEPILLDWDVVRFTLTWNTNLRNLSFLIYHSKGGPSSNGYKSPRDMVLRRCTIQHLQNAHRPLSIEKMRTESYPTSQGCGYIQKIRENLPISSWIVGVCVVGRQVCQAYNLPFLVCTIN